jgi:hypothetical protein
MTAPVRVIPAMDSNIKGKARCMKAAKIKMPRTAREAIRILRGFFLILAVSEPVPVDT